MNDRFRFRAWSFVERKYYYDAEETYDFMNGIDCDSFGELLNNDKFIVEQCTGIVDCNGKLIYEGDIVKCDIDFIPSGRVGLIRTVIFKDGVFQLISEDGGFYFIMGFHNIKIIGNIHETEKEK